MQYITKEPKSLHILHRLSNSAELKELYHTGQLYESLDDHYNALITFNQGYKLGDVRATTSLAFYHHFGLGGLEINKKKSLKLLEQAARSGYAHAQYNLAKLIQFGDGVEQNFTEALYWYDKADKQNYHGARNKVELLKHSIASNLSASTELVLKTNFLFKIQDKSIVGCYISDKNLGQLKNFIKKHDNRLQILDLRDNHITCQGAAVLSKILIKPNFIKKLILNNNQIKAQGVTALRCMLKVNAQIEEIQLKQQKIGWSDEIHQNLQIYPYDYQKYCIQNRELKEKFYLAITNLDIDNLIGIVGGFHFSIIDYKFNKTVNDIKNCGYFILLKINNKWALRAQPKYLLEVKKLLLYKKLINKTKLLDHLQSVQISNNDKESIKKVLFKIYKSLRLPNQKWINPYYLRDRNGNTGLHLYVINRNNDLYQFFKFNFPKLLSVRNNDDKTAEELILLNDVIDIKNKTINHAFIISPSQLSVDKLQYIDEGSFGKVFKTKLSYTTVAVKKFDNCLDIDSDINKQYNEISFKKEIASCCQILHPHLVQIIGAYYSLGHWHIVMEFMAGGTLTDKLDAIRENNLPTITTIEQSHIIKNIAKGLDYLHNIVDIIHCDIKSYNILFTKHGQAKLADFGLSVSKQLIANNNDTLSRSPYWLAPEIINHKCYTTASDIYSFGVVLWEIVSLNRPFSTRFQELFFLDKVDKIKQCITSGDIDLVPESCCCELAFTINACRHIDPDKRFILDDIFTYLYNTKYSYTIASVQPTYGKMKKKVCYLWYDDKQWNLQCFFHNKLIHTCLNNCEHQLIIQKLDVCHMNNCQDKSYNKINDIKLNQLLALTSLRTLLNHNVKIDTDSSNENICLKKDMMNDCFIYLGTEDESLSQSMS